MMRSLISAALAAAVVLAALNGPVFGQQERKAGDKIVYTFQQSGKGGQMNGTKALASVFTFTIDGTDSDGNSHATATMEMQGIRGAPKTSFEAAISPTGAILTKTDPNLKPTMGMSLKDASAIAANDLEMQLQSQLAMMNFNTFADTCSKRTLHVGDTWKAPMQLGQDTIVYTVTGRQTQQGRDTFAVAMKPAPGSTNSFTGQGFYDPVAHLVVGLHMETALPGQNESIVNDMTLSS